MSNVRVAALFTLLLTAPLATVAGEDSRTLVKLPPMMQQHMLGNMRDHLVSLNTILGQLAEGKLDAAADIAEQRLGMSSMEAHGAAHMAPYMPAGMRDAGSALHHAASQFALVAQEGNPAKAYAALHKVTMACVACHTGYRIR